VPHYEGLYRGRAYLGKAEVEPVRREVAELRNRFAVAEPTRVPRPPGAIERPSGAIGRTSGATKHSSAPARRGAEPARPKAPRRISAPGPVQLSLDALAPTPISGPAGRNHRRRSVVSAA
jgi:hypothetical protein